MYAIEGGCWTPVIRVSRVCPVSAEIGAAFGVAIVTTVAVTSSVNCLAAKDGANPLVLLNEGFQSAF